MNSKKFQKIFLRATIAISLACFIYLNLMVCVPHDSFSSSNISEFQTVVSSSFPELTFIKEVITKVVDIITLT